MLSQKNTHSLNFLPSFLKRAIWHSLDTLITDPKQKLNTLSKRKKKVIEKKISAKTFEILEQKAELEKAEGWRIRKTKKKKPTSYWVEKDKPLDEQLEDELWCTVAKMGFDELIPTCVQD